MPPYEHRQLGPGLVAVGIAQLLVGIGVFFINRPVGAAIAVIGGLTPWLFATLTLVVDDEAVSFHFGPGLIARRIALADVRSCRVVRLPWYSGVGIHFTRNGILYNVAFGPVVQLALATGRQVNIGSPEPDVVCEEIRSRARHAPATSSDGSAEHGVPWPIVSAVLLAGVGLLAAVLVVWNGQRPVAITVSPAALTMSGAGYSTTIATRDIVAVSLQQTAPRIARRTNAYEFGSKLRGAFSLADIGPADLYVDLDVPLFLVVRTPTSTVIVNAPSVETTRGLFDRVRDAMPVR